MDENIYRSVPLDAALAPEPGAPLLPTQFVPNGGISTQNIAYTGVLKITKPASSTSGQAQVAHPLGYVPIMLAYFAGADANGNLVATSLAQMPYLEPTTSGAVVNIAIGWFASVDKDNVYVFAQTGLSGVGFDGVRIAYIQFYLLQGQIKTS